MILDKQFVVLCGLIIATACYVHGGGSVVPVALPKPLAAFPQVVGSFTLEGKQSFDDDVVRVAGMDDYLMWQYRDKDGYTIGLYIGYYRDQIEGGIIHSPKHCMPGSGWEPTQMNEDSVTATDGKNYKISRMVLQKRGDKQIAHYWFHGRGRVVANEYVDKCLMIWDSITRKRSDGTLVRVTGPGNNEPLDNKKQIEFIGEVLPMISNFLP